MAGGSGDLNFFLQISFSGVKMIFYVEFHPPWLPGTGQKVFGGGGWVSGLCKPISVLGLDQAEQYHFVAHLAS